MDAGSVNTDAVPTEYDNSTDTDPVPLIQYNSFMKMATISEKEHLDFSKTAALSTSICDSYECFVCVEVKPNTEIWHSPCEGKHLTCYDCVRQCYHVAIKNLAPNFACCCGIPIWDENVREKILGKDLTEEWLDCLKAVDNINQVYCSTFNCWRPLNEHAHGSGSTAVLTCPKCCLGTCGWCLEANHPGEKCTFEEGE
ncbi:hypothetical protein MMC14_008858 [Varicellaria rhodocarpa]|nr:hypothetical protein [Varicellaria rhodocarpa]